MTSDRAPVDEAATAPVSGGTRAAGQPVSGTHPRPRTDRRVPLLVLVAVALQLTLGVVWTVLEPPYAGLDERNHVAGVMQLVYHHTWPAPRDLAVTQGVAVSNAEVQAGLTGPRANAPAVPRGQRRSLDSLGGAAKTSLRSQMAQHPPLYYGLVAAVLRVTPGQHERAWDREIWIMRVISAFLIAPLPLLAWAAMRRFTRSVDLQLAAAVAPLLLPSLGRIAGSVSNDSLLILTMSVLALGVARIATGDASRRTAAWTGLAAMLALLTKGTALVAPLWLALAYLWCWRGGRRRVVAPVLTAALPVLIGLLWWLRNVIAFGAVQPAGALPAPGQHAGGYLHFSNYFFSAVSFRFWSALGNPEPPQLDRTLTQVATFVVLGLLLLGLLAARRRSAAVRDTGGRVAALVLLFGALAVLGIVTEGSLANYHTYGRFNGVQGRYLYPTLIPLLVLPVIGVGSLLRGRLRPLAPVGVAVFAGLLQVNAGRDVMRTIWEPAGGGLRDGAHRLLEWSPWSAPVTEGGFALLAFAAVLFGVVLLAGTARRLLAPAPIVG